MVTIDASVLIAATLESEAAIEEARAFMRAVGRSNMEIHEPTLAVVELASGIAHRTGRRDLVAEGVRLLLALPGATFHGLDLPDAVATAMHAADLGLRSGDAVYAATASATGSTLVTLDRELQERAAPLVAAMTPGEWVAREDT